MDFIYHLLGYLPFECLEPQFMRQALLGLLLLAPATAMLGVHVVNFRMAFFSDAVGHSAFAGLAIGLLLGVDPQAAVLGLGVVIGISIMAIQRKSGMSADAAIGIVFSAVVAFGLAVVSRAPSVARDVQQYLYGDVLTITENEILILAFLLFLLVIFEIFGWNKLLAISLSPTLAKLNCKSIAFWQYLLAGLLALVVMFAVRTVGVLLVTALLIVPAATARNFAANMAGVFWWGIVVSITSCVGGLLLSAQDWLATASGATVILFACAWFAVSCLWKKNK